MKDKQLTQKLIQSASVLHGERVLIIDSDDSLVKYYKDQKLELNIVFCDYRDFRTITQYPDDYMNSFDVIICPEAVYSIKTTERHQILQCIVWAMKRTSRLVFAIPDIKQFVIGKKKEIDGKKYVLKDEGMYYKFIETGFKWLRAEKEFWHKTTVRFPSQVLHAWNTANPNSPWDFNHSGISESGLYVVYSIDMRKFPVNNDAPEIITS